MLFNKQNKPEIELLDTAIVERIAKLDDTSGDPEKDKIAIENLKDLAIVKAEVNGDSKKISRNTIFSVVSGFVLIGATFVFEKSDVISTKLWPTISRKVSDLIK